MKPKQPFLRKKLSHAVSLALAVSAAAAAQETPPPTDTEDAQQGKVEEVVVTGFRRSLENSLAIKQTSDSIVEAVSAEDIGKLPDVSIAESLARLPGLTAQRLNGRGQVISVRGLSPDFTTALLNGREQVSTGDNRGVEFDQYPSELLSSVIIYKTPDAALIGQGLAGTADMRTIRPLQHHRPEFGVNLRYEKTEIDALNAGSPDDGWRYSLSYVDQFADDTFGVAFGYAHIENPSQEERFNSWGYPTVGTDLLIGGAKPYVRSSELERDGVIGVLEFQPTEAFSTALDVYYSEFDETQWLRGIELPLYWGGAPLEPGFTAVDGLITEGTFDNVKGVMRNDVNTRGSKLKAVGWNTDFDLGENWKGGTDVSYSRVDRADTVLETYSGTGPAGQGATDTVGFDMSGGEGAVFSTQLDYADPNLILLTSPQGWGGDIVPGGQLGYSNNPNIDDELNQLRLKARRELGGNISGVEFGVNIAQREKSLDEDEFFLALASGATSEPIPVVTGTTDLSFLGIPGMVSYDPLALIDQGVYDLVPNPNADVLTKSWVVEEDVDIAYLKLDLETEWGSVPVRGNFGTQIVHTDQASHALGALGTGANVSAFPLSDGKNYTDILPSLNLNFEVATDQYVRVGVARTLARPRMDDLRASQQVTFDPNINDPNDPTISAWGGKAGNPLLDPWLANALDVSYENYFSERAGYVSVALFYKDLESYIFDASVPFDFTGYPSSEPPGTTLGIITQPQNGKGGSLKGIEFSVSGTGEMLTPVLTGFGAILTYSYTKSEIQPDPANPDARLPGLSDDVANLTLYYENHGFSARVSDRYRSEFLGEVAGFGNGRNLRTINSESIVDAQIGYTFSGRLDGVALLLQANNLTDEPFETFANGDPQQLIDFQRYGRSYLLGISYRR